MKNKKTLLILFTAVLAVLFISNCRYDKASPTYNNFPENIGKLMFTKCATAGCHTDASKDAAGGLSMESWDKLFEGGDGSACVIPYRHDYSTLFYYTNTYTDLGVTLTPTMPYGHDHLSRADVIMLRDWIDAGAPSADGQIKFSGPRKKFYVTNQGCDVVTVFDEATLLPMRYVNIGASAGIESPHMVRVSPDGQYWYVVSLGGAYLEKYSTLDESFVGRALINAPTLTPPHTGNWNSFALTSDGQRAFCVDWSSSGDIAEVNLNTMTTTHNIGFNNPHGSCIDPTGNFLYATEQNNSNMMIKAPTGDISLATEFNLYNTAPPPYFLNSHDIRFSPDGTKYFVTCQSQFNISPEVRVFQSSNDSLLAAIPVGPMPSEISVSSSTPYLFVTCMEDTIHFAGKRGSVAMINYDDYSVSFIYTGHQPHGIEVDEDKKLVYVINRNASSDGPAPHHTGECAGRNGNVSFIDLNTRTMVMAKNGTSIKKVEIAVDPYSVAVKH